MFIGNTVYTHTSISRFDACPFRYKGICVDMCVPRDGGPPIEFFVARCVSDALKRLYREVISGRLPAIGEAIETYGAIWNEEYSGEVLISRPGASAREYFDAGKERVARYFTRYWPFNQSEIIQNDLLVAFFLRPESRGFPLVTMLDRIDRRADGAHEVHIYLTSESLPHEKLRQDLEIGFNLLGFRHQFPDIENVELVRHDLTNDEEKLVTMTARDLVRIEAEIMRLITTIENDKKFEPRKSEFCKWCEWGLELCASMSSSNR